MKNNWWVVGDCEYIRVLNNDVQYLNTETRHELFVSLKSLEWQKSDSIEDLHKELKSKTEAEKLHD